MSRSARKREDAPKRPLVSYILTIAQLYHISIIGPGNDRQNEDHWYPFDGLHAPPTRAVLLAHSVHRTVDSMHEDVCLLIAAHINNALSFETEHSSSIASTTTTTATAKAPPRKARCSLLFYEASVHGDERRARKPLIAQVTQRRTRGVMNQFSVTLVCTAPLCPLSR